MQLSYEWWIGLRYTRAGRGVGRNGFISFISGVSMLGIALGVAALIIVLSVMNGFQKEVLGKMLSVLSHIEVQAADGQPIPDLAARMARIQQHPAVVGVAPFISSQVLLARGEDMKGVVLRGIDPSLEPKVAEMTQNPRAREALAALAPGSRGIALGVYLARALGVGVGDRVTVVTPSGQLGPNGMAPSFSQWTVVGVFDFGHYEYDSGMAMVHVSDGLRLFHLEGPTGIRVKLTDLHQARAVAADLDRMLNADNRSGGVVVQDWSQQNRTWFAAVQVEKRMMFIILTLIVAVAAFNLVSTLVMTVTDKRADIAILRTLGASPRSIMGIFVVQGAMVGVIGTLLGLLLGLLVAFNIDVIVPTIERLFNARFLPPELYIISKMPSDPQSGDIVPIAIISFLLAFAATLYPSWQASRVNPARALRYE